MISHQNKQGNTYVIIDWVYYNIFFSKEVSIFLRVTKNIELCVACGALYHENNIEPRTFGARSLSPVNLFR